MLRFLFLLAIGINSYGLEKEAADTLESLQLKIVKGNVEKVGNRFDISGDENGDVEINGPVYVTDGMSCNFSGDNIVINGSVNGFVASEGLAPNLLFDSLHSHEIILHMPPMDDADAKAEDNFQVE